MGGDSILGPVWVGEYKAIRANRMKETKLVNKDQKARELRLGERERLRGKHLLAVPCGGGERVRKGEPRGSDYPPTLLLSLLKRRLV